MGIKESGSAGFIDLSIAELRRIVDGKDASGLGVRKYCQQIGISPSQFYKYQRRLSSNAETKAMVKARAPVEKFIELGEVKSGGREWTVELALSSGVIIRVR
jgi:hypothetical protein